MTAPESLSDAGLVAHILERFHEGHRRDLPPLQAAARAIAPALADHLDAMALALENHMFKEEARVFPMIEQGGHGLLPLLLAEMDAEHRAHEDALVELQRLADAQPLPPALAAALAHLAGELQAHVAIEDGVLFARFAHRPTARPLS